MQTNKIFNEEYLKATGLFAGDDHRIQPVALVLQGETTIIARATHKAFNIQEAADYAQVYYGAQYKPATYVAAKFVGKIIDNKIEPCESDSFEMSIIRIVWVRDNTTGDMYNILPLWRRERGPSWGQLNTVDNPPDDGTEQWVYELVPGLAPMPAPAPRGGTPLPAGTTAAGVLAGLRPPTMTPGGAPPPICRRQGRFTLTGQRAGGGVGRVMLRQS